MGEYGKQEDMSQNEHRRSNVKSRTLFQLASARRENTRGTITQRGTRQYHSRITVIQIVWSVNTPMWPGYK